MVFLQGNDIVNLQGFTVFNFLMDFLGQTEICFYGYSIRRIFINIIFEIYDDYFTCFWEENGKIIKEFKEEYPRMDIEKYEKFFYKFNDLLKDDLILDSLSIEDVVIMFKNEYSTKSARKL